MKKIIFSLLVLLAFSNLMNGQEISDNAIGLRFGDNAGFGGEISYQKKLSNINRLEVDLGFRSRSNENDAFKLTGIYQWMWNIDQGFNWYAGFGAGVGSWTNNNINSTKNDGMFLNADGNIGIEYNFDIPLLISLDFRPEIGLLGNYSDADLDLALSLRYQF